MQEEAGENGQLFRVRDEAGRESQVYYKRNNVGSRGP